VLTAAEELVQFGTRLEGLDYKPRQGAYGILVRDGRLACVQVGYSRFTYDLPGGAVEAGETPEQALVREYLEETGLLVRVTKPVVEFRHYFLMEDGTPFNNHSHIFEVEFVADRPAGKVEDDHELIWLPPLEVIKRITKEGYAWGIVNWLRRRD
jgi:8-oxo-dGTP diphosphatase